MIRARPPIAACQQRTVANDGLGDAQARAKALFLAQLAMKAASRNRASDTHGRHLRTTADISSSRLITPP